MFAIIVLLNILAEFVLKCSVAKDLDRKMSCFRFIGHKLPQCNYNYYAVELCNFV